MYIYIYIYINIYIYIYIDRWRRRAPIETRKSSVVYPSRRDVLFLVKTQLLLRRAESAVREAAGVLRRRVLSCRARGSFRSHRAPRVLRERKKSCDFSFSFSQVVLLETEEEEEAPLAAAEDDVAGDLEDDDAADDDAVADDDDAEEEDALAARASAAREELLELLEADRAFRQEFGDDAFHLRELELRGVCSVFCGECGADGTLRRDSFAACVRALVAAGRAPSGPDGRGAPALSRRMRNDRWRNKIRSEF